MIPGYYQRDGGQRCAPTHKKMLMDRVTEKVQLESQRIFPTTPSQWPFPLHELRHVYDHQSRTGEQISLMTLSRPQGTIAANAGSSLRTAVSCKKKPKNQRNFFLYLKLEEVQLLHAFGPACESSKILGGKLTNKGTTSHQ